MGKLPHAWKAKYSGSRVFGLERDFSFSLGLPVGSSRAPTHLFPSSFPPALLGWKTGRKQTDLCADSGEAGVGLRHS